MGSKWKINEKLVYLIRLEFSILQSSISSGELGASSRAWAELNRAFAEALIKIMLFLSMSDSSESINKSNYRLKFHVVCILTIIAPWKSKFA